MLMEEKELCNYVYVYLLFAKNEKKEGLLVIKVKVVNSNTNMSLNQFNDERI